MATEKKRFFCALRRFRPLFFFFFCPLLPPFDLLFRYSSSSSKLDHGCAPGWRVAQGQERRKEEGMKKSDSFRKFMSGGEGEANQETGRSARSPGRRRSFFSVLPFQAIVRKRSIRQFWTFPSGFKLELYLPFRQSRTGSPSCFLLACMLLRGQEGNLELRLPHKDLLHPSARITTPPSACLLGPLSDSIMGPLFFSFFCPDSP